MSSIIHMHKVQTNTQVLSTLRANLHECPHFWRCDSVDDACVKPLKDKVGVEPSTGSELPPLVPSPVSLSLSLTLSHSYWKKQKQKQKISHVKTISRLHVRRESGQEQRIVLYKSYE